MANTSIMQQGLAMAPRFKLRVQAGLVYAAWAVLDEDPATTGHAVRATYARLVLAEPSVYTAEIIKSLVSRPAFNTPDTTFDFDLGEIVSAVLDFDIAAQIATDWDKLSGV